MKIWGMTLGGYPRSRIARYALRDKERGDITYGRVEEEIIAASSAVIGAQLAAGFPYVVDGMLDWHDIFRPFVEAWRNVTPTGLLRYFDNNFFYRIPVFIDDPEPTNPVLASRVRRFLPLAEPAKIKVVIPGPVTLVRMSQNRSGLSDSELVERVATLLADEAKKAVKAGASLVQVDEPFLTDIDATEDDARLAVEMASLIKSKAGVPIALSVYFNVPEPKVYEVLIDSDADYLGIDVIDAPERGTELITAFSGIKPVLMLGVIDARRIYDDDFDKIASIVERVVEKTGAKELVLTTSTWLDLISYKYAIRKTRLLGGLVDFIAEKLGGEGYTIWR